MNIAMYIYIFLHLMDTFFPQISYISFPPTSGGSLHVTPVTMPLIHGTWQAQADCA